MQNPVSVKRPARTLKPKENLIELSILQFLEFLPGCYAWKNQTTGYFNPKLKKFTRHKSKYAINGVSDILGIYKGRLLAIEVKRPDNKVRTEAQSHFIEQIKKRGGIAFYATSVEDVQFIMKAYL